jgi:hypothetical protein
MDRSISHGRLAMGAIRAIEHHPVLHKRWILHFKTSAIVIDRASIPRNANARGPI